MAWPTRSSRAIASRAWSRATLGVAAQQQAAREALDHQAALVVVVGIEGGEGALPVGVGLGEAPG